MLESVPSRHTSPRRARNEAPLKQIGLVHVFERIARLAQRSGESFNADRATVVMLDDHCEVAPVHLIEAGFVDLETLERLPCRRPV